MVQDPAERDRETSRESSVTRAPSTKCETDETDEANEVDEANEAGNADEVKEAGKPGEADERPDRLAGVPTALYDAWRQRLLGSSTLEGAARSLLEADVAMSTLATAVLAAAEDGAEEGVEDGVVSRVETASGRYGPSTSADVAGDEGACRAAAGAGRAACRADIDLGTLHAVFGELGEALFSQLIDRRNVAAESSSQASVERCQRDAARAVRPVAVAACEGWMGERGRAFRHDIKTPLQAASLNLELLALEGAGSGLDLDALEVIQRSLDQAVEIVDLQDPDGRARGG